MTISALSSSSSDALSSLRQKLFQQLDTNNDGTISKAEFIAGRPKNMSEAQAGALYDKIDSDGSNALTQTQLDAGLAANRPAHAHGGGHHAKPADDTTDNTDGTTDTPSLSSNLSSSVVATILQAIQNLGTSATGTTTDTDSADNGSAAAGTATSTSADNSSAASATAAQNTLLQQILKATEAYANNFAAHTAASQPSALATSV